MDIKSCQHLAKQIIVGTELSPAILDRVTGIIANYCWDAEDEVDRSISRNDLTEEEKKGIEDDIALAKRCMKSVPDYIYDKSLQEVLPF